MFDDAAEVPLGETNKEDVGKRLALNKQDWDNITAEDLFAIFSTLTKSDHLVTKIEIYPSLFGIERMAHDSRYGPPKEIFNDEEDVLKKQASKKKQQKEAKK